MPFSHIKTWIFDLDDTLYPSSNGFLDQIDHHITNFLAVGKNISYEEAVIVREKYRTSYGTSLEGMIKEDNLSHIAYYDYIAENIDYSTISPCKETKDLIKKLPGRKLIYSNGEFKRVSKVLKMLDMQDVFDGIYDILWAELQDKQKIQPYEKLLRELQVSANECVMIEDSHKNLKPAHDLGMTTILVHGEKEGRDYIHHAYPSLLDFLKEQNKNAI